MNWVKNGDNGILKPGDVFEKYSVEKLLGKGGMGAVYLVRHNVLDSLFALKVLFPDVASHNKKFVDRFIREAKLACKITHPNLIAVHDAGQNSKNGMYYIIMDYVSGGSVRDLLKRVGHISPQQAVPIIQQMASALETAQKHNMVHRDIKPDNIMFTSDGTAKLADLGIAKSTNEQDTMLTLEATVFGTPAYMSPEQAMDSRKVDCRADIYSLGIVLYEMLSGQRPYHGNSTIEILSQVIRDEDISDIRTIMPLIQEDLATLLNQMCTKNIKKRIQSPSELLKRLEQIVITKNDDECSDKTIPLVKTEVTLPTMEFAEKTKNDKSMSDSAVPSDVTMPTVEAPIDLRSSVSSKENSQALDSPDMKMEPARGKNPEAILSSGKAVKHSSVSGAADKGMSPNIMETRIAEDASYPIKHPSFFARLDKKHVLIVMCVCFCAVLILICGFFFLRSDEKPSRKSSPKHSAIQSSTTPSSATDNVSISENASSTESRPGKIFSPVPPAALTSSASPFDPLKKNTFVLLGGATEQLKSFKEEYIKRNGAASISFLEAENFSQYRKQLSSIIDHAPYFVLLAPAGRYAELGMSSSSFDLLILNEANMLFDKGIPFAFVMETPEDSEKMQIFNNSIRALCNLKSFTLIDASEENSQSFYEKNINILKP